MATGSVVDTTGPLVMREKMEWTLCSLASSTAA